MGLLSGWVHGEMEMAEEVVVVVAVVIEGRGAKKGGKHRSLHGLDLRHVHHHPQAPPYALVHLKFLDSRAHVGALL